MREERKNDPIRWPPLDPQYFEEKGRGLYISMPFMYIGIIRYMEGDDSQSQR